MTGNISIEHEATVRRLLPESSEIEVIVSDKESDNCSACAAAALCKHGGGILRIHVANPADYKSGMRVLIGASSATHRKAVGLMLGLPCLMLILPIIALCILGIPEWVALLVGIAACGATYMALWYSRQKLDSAGQFKIISRLS